MADQAASIRSETVLTDDVDFRHEPSPATAAPPGSEAGGMRAADHGQPISAREPAAVVLMVLAFDLTVYRSFGYTGYAAWLLIAPLLLALGMPRLRPRPAVAMLAAMLVLLAARMFWQGNPASFASGMVLLVATAVALAGRSPYVVSVAAYFVQTLVAGPYGLLEYFRHSRRQSSAEDRRGGPLSVVLPLVAVLLFGAIFILANPDLVTRFSNFAVTVGQWLRDSLQNMVPEAPEVVLWGVVALVTIGLFRPLLPDSQFAPRLRRERATAGPLPAVRSAKSPLYAAFRNTLVALNVLFAVYLVFEFKTLWVRSFPEGFYYAGYAHEGAAWLTAALALATVVLSVMFRGRLLHDRRIGRLRVLAWVWAAQNLILAGAVYNRMHIYIDFNGMTRMRTVGLLGITCVIVGFGLVIWKIIRRRSFVWLLHWQLGTVALFVYLYLLLPVDALVHHYNVRRVLAGDLAPVVQISVHPNSSEGVRMLPPLLASSDPIIRDGIQALLAERYLALHQQAALRHTQNWTAYQHADQLLLTELHALRSQWERQLDDDRRQRSLERFHEYAYQWY